MSAFEMFELLIFGAFAMGVLWMLLELAGRF